eukprot:scaffold10933_cov20-Tisochrysis_lutea.AAC.2
MLLHFFLRGQVVATVHLSILMIPNHRAENDKVLSTAQFHLQAISQPLSYWHLSSSSTPPESFDACHLGLQMLPACLWSSWTKMALLLMQKCRRHLRSMEGSMKENDRDCETVKSSGQAKERRVAHCVVA